MAITSKGQSVILQAVIYEDEVPALRKILMESAPEALNFDFNDCDDVHLAVIQQILAYQKMYECSYTFADEVKTYQKVIEGFDENECSF